MPVFNTGRLLLASVRSILDQSLLSASGTRFWELLIIDDASTDPETRRALAEAAEMSPCILVLPNARTRGVAGARNTGIFAARGEWIAFLDSDDLWYRDFLEGQFKAFSHSLEAHWRAAHFDVGDENAHVVSRPLKDRSPCLHAVIALDHDAGRISVLRRPVEVLLRCGCLQVMTVQIRNDLIRTVGGFDETLSSAEDYDLWIRLAVAQDLHLAPLDAGVYRVRPGSLTKAGRPMYWCEDVMLLRAKRDVAFATYRSVIDARLVKVYDTFCFHFRKHRMFADAGRYATRLIALSPLRLVGWKQLVATLFHR